MNARVKREIQNKARLIYCLANILEYDSENLKNDTKQNITDLLVEIEYILYLDDSRL